jgi:protoheme IX farnesyltransferase
MAVPRSVVMDYVALTKPRIISLLLFTALGGMFLASRGAPDLSLMLLVLSGGALAAGGANALNHYLDRDIDGRMSRTRNRPVAVGRVRPQDALVFGIALNVVAMVILTTWVNALSAGLTLSATLFYALVYTKGLKRTSPHNIVIGGAAGAIPPMVGWVAVTGHVGLPALYMFAIVFFWTPPHFWALALLLKDDYTRAGIPMLPVVAGTGETKRAIFLYSWMVVAVTVMFAASGAVGWIYLATSTLVGAGLIWYSWALLRKPDIEGARSLYLYSLLYLGVLFLAIIVDSTVAI